MGDLCPLLREMVERENMWLRVVKAVPGDFDFDTLFVKILFYKALNGGAIRKKLKSHQPLRKLAKAAGREAEDLGLDIIDT